MSSQSSTADIYSNLLPTSPKLDRRQKSKSTNIQRDEDEQKVQALQKAKKHRANSENLNYINLLDISDKNTIHTGKTEHYINYRSSTSSPHSSHSSPKPGSERSRTRTLSVQGLQVGRNNRPISESSVFLENTQQYKQPFATQPPRFKNTINMSATNSTSQIIPKPVLKKPSNLSESEKAEKQKNGGNKDQKAKPKGPSNMVKFMLGDHKGRDIDDLSPRIFCEMQVIHRDHKSQKIGVWKETARWVKFEEDVEDGGDRWSKPHVATLSTHSIFELRDLLANGTICLEMDATGMHEIVDLAVEAMVKNSKLLPDKPNSADIIETLKKQLLARHEHQNDSHHHNKSYHRDKSDEKMTESHFGIGRTSSDPKTTVLPGSKDKALDQADINKNDENVPPVTSSNSLTDKEKPNKEKQKFLKHIPKGSEAANILVGTLSCIQQPVMAFVRLKNSQLLPGICEVDIPTKFFFFLVGGKDFTNYYQIGRSLSTIMSDDIFHIVAYKAKNRQDLMAGLDEFLDKTTVLPPGEWDPKIRIEPPEKLPAIDIDKRLNMHPDDIEKDCPHAAHGDDPALQKTGKLFGGLIEDIKRKRPFYFSDLKDCLDLKCLSSFFFLYFAVITPVITFGGLWADATNKEIAAIESLLGAALSGSVYHLLSGQPLRFCEGIGLNFTHEVRLFMNQGLT